MLRCERLIGEIIGDYRIVAPLATGGLGEIFVGEHKDRGTKAAVEVLAADTVQHAAAVQRYLHTERKIARLHHASALRFEDAGLTASGRGYVVRELIDTDTLTNRIRSLGRLSLTQIGEIARQVANFLAALHDESVIHGDLRPDVLWLVPHGGLARGEPVKVTELAVATFKRAAGLPIAPTYSAPELFTSGAAVDWRVDAYGLGCVVFEMATGRAPFIGTDDEVRAKHLTAVPPAARSLMPDVAPSLDSLIGRLLSKSPDDRFGSMREIARAFDQLGGGSRPLATTATEMPAVVVGELGVQGEIQARATAEPSSGVPTESIIAPTGSTRVDPALLGLPPHPSTAPIGRPIGDLGDSTLPIPKTGSPNLMWIVLFVVVAGLAVAVVLAIR